MPNRYRSWVRWPLYALWTLLAMTVQTLTAGWTWPICAFPPCLICVAMLEGAESGGLFALIASIVWCLSGADMGPLSIVILTACAVGTGVACDRLLTTGILPCLMLCLAALILNEGGIFLLRVLMGSLRASVWFPALPATIVKGLIAAPFLWALCRLSRKAGGF